MNAIDAAGICYDNPARVAPPSGGLSTEDACATLIGAMTRRQLADTVAQLAFDEPDMVRRWLLQQIEDGVDLSGVVL